MTEQTQPSIGERSTFARFFRWLFSWRGIRRLLIVLAWTITAIALLYGVENWRGRRAWNKQERELRARGEQLELKAFLPKPVPDAENFAATPIVQSWFPGNTTWEDDYLRVHDKVPPSQDQGLRRFIDLVAWSTAFDAPEADRLKAAKRYESGKLDRESRASAAARVLQGLKSSEGKLEELRRASARPLSRYPVNYNLENPWGILLPHLVSIKAACQRLQLRASAQLALGNTAAALEDVKLMLYLADSLENEPFLISCLVRIACIQIAIHPIWEGLAEQRWSAAQLDELQKRFASYNFFAGLAHALDAERAAGILTADLLRQGKYRLSHLAGHHEAESSMVPAADWLARLAPRGWYHQEKANFCILFEKHTHNTFDVQAKRVFPQAVKQRDKELQQELAGSAGANRALSGVLRHRILSALLLPALGNVARRPATAHACVDQAAIACALERYRQAHGQFPESLSALAPQFMPQVPADVLTSESYKYKRTGSGQFILYSPGWDERDDGGTPGATLFDERSGDWVWQYPGAETKPGAASN